MNYDFYILAFLVIICSLLVAIFDKLGKKNHVMIISSLIALFGVITIVKQCDADKAEISIVEKEKLDQKRIDSTSAALTDTINYKIETVKLFQKKLNDSTNIILQGQYNLIDNLQKSVNIQNRLVQSQRETIKQVLGDGFPIIEIKQRDKKLYYSVVRNSNASYSLFDVQITALDFNKLQSENFRKENFLFYYSQDSIYKYSTIIPELVVRSGSSTSIPYEVSRENLPKFVAFKSISRNGVTMQYSILLELKGFVYHSYQIFRLKDRKYELLESKNTQLINPKVWDEKFLFKKSYDYEYY